MEGRATGPHSRWLFTGLNFPTSNPFQKGKPAPDSVLGWLLRCNDPDAEWHASALGRYRVSYGKYDYLYLSLMPLG